MAEGKQGTEPTEQAATEPHGTEQVEPERDWKREYDKLLAQSRKWETRAKDNAAAAKKLAEMEDASKSDAEKLADATKRAESAEAKLAEYERKAERAAIVAEVAAAKGVDPDWLSRMAGDDREAIEANAAFIAGKLAGAPVYPSVADNGGGKAPTDMSPKEIENIKDPVERLRARAEYASRNRRK